MPASAYSHDLLIEDQKQQSKKMSNFDLINNFNEKINLNNDNNKNVTDCVPVPSSEHVAEIVGRQGCKIKALRAKTNTYIKTPIRGESPMFTITGRKEDVNMAKKEILSAAEHFSQIRARRNHGNNTPTPPSSSQSFTPTPSTSPSLLSSSSSSSSSSESTTTSSSKTINSLILPPSSSSAQTSNNTSHTNEQYVNVPGQITLQVRVPYRVVGLVVGPKGSTIKRIQQQTQTYIITPSRDKDPVFEITGLPDNVDAAKQDIETYIALRTTSTSASTTTTTTSTTSLLPSTTTTSSSIPTEDHFDQFYPTMSDYGMIPSSSTSSVLKSTFMNNDNNNLLASNLLTSSNYMQKLNNLASTSSIWSSGTSSTTTTTTLTTSPLLSDTFEQASNYDSLLMNDNFYTQQQQQQQQTSNAQSIYQTIRSSSSLSSSASSSCSSASVSLSSSQTNCGNLNGFPYDAFNEQQQYEPFNDLTFLNERFNFYNQQQQQYDDSLFPLASNNQPSIMMQLLIQEQQQQQQQQFLFKQQQIINKCFLCNNKMGSNDGLNNDLITYQTNKLCLNCAQNIAYQHTEQLQ
jgi:RNA-binding protein MEX3